MSNDVKLDAKSMSEVRARLGRIATDEFELFKQRTEIEKELNNTKTNRSSKELKGLKTQYWALGKAMNALAKQRIAILSELDSSNMPNKDDSSDKAKLINKLKNEEYELLDKLDKLSAFLLDDDKVAKINDEHLRLLQMQQQAMTNYHRILVARIFNLETDKEGHNND